MGFDVSVSVFLSHNTITISIGHMHSGRLVFEWQRVRLADVHSVLFCLQIFIVAFIFIIVLGLAVVRGGVAGQCWRWWHRGWSRVTEA